MVARYASRRGIEIPQWQFYHAYGLFKIAVVVQQIYARYKAGLTQDARFAHLDVAVRLLGRQALRSACGAGGGGDLGVRV